MGAKEASYICGAPKNPKKTKRLQPTPLPLPSLPLARSLNHTPPIILLLLLLGKVQGEGKLDVLLHSNHHKIVARVETGDPPSSSCAVFKDPCCALGYISYT